MPGQNAESAVAGNLLLNRFQIITMKLDHLTAGGAHEVVVVCGSDTGFVSLEALVEIVLGGETDVHEKPEGPVDRGLPDMCITSVQPVGDIVRGQVSARLEEHAGNGFALVGYR